MSVCALEIMENNNMIATSNKYWVYKITTERDPCEKDVIKEIKLQYKIIRIKTGGKKFDKKFRELMKKSGYVCTPAENYGDGEKFVKTSDIDKFVKELPKKETIYLKKLCWFVEKYIQESNTHFRIKNIDNRYNKNIFKNYNTITEITNNEIKQNRIEQAKQKEEESIRFMEQLFK